MEIIDGMWTMRGLAHDDPKRIRSADELAEYINEVGFLPLFSNEIPGFSSEELTASQYWWCDIPEHDPWIWREQIARTEKIAYGKFFGGRAGYISLEWLPYFVNWRRDGYDFDSLFEDGKAQHRSKKIMDLFLTRDRLFSYEIKKLAGFGKNGEKNFPGVITKLQEQIYLVSCDFQRRRNAKGEPYGMTTTLYATPESIWGYDTVTAAYSEEPEQSKQRIVEHIRKLYGNVDDKTMEKVLGK
ncbi:MAG: hypothetical protein J1E39_03965 [Eubacterium sp.]|nr:hypothetical protein [Eubacterium sp.]